MGVGRPVNRVRGDCSTSLNCDGRCGLALLGACALLLLPALAGDAGRRGAAL